MSGGLELRRPSSDQIKSYDTLDTRNFAQRINQNPEMVPYFEELLKEWCDQIEEYLADPDIHDPINQQSRNLGNQPRDIGPKGELHYWRTRMQRLTLIMEQLKRKDCKNLTGLLSALTRGSSNENKSKIMLLLC